MQAVNLLLCRDPLRSAFAGRWTANPLLFLGLAVEFAMILGIAYTPWGNRLFGSAPIGWEVWLYALPFALAMLVLEEARKALQRRRG
jgi:hypothetical protein